MNNLLYKEFNLSITKFFIIMPFLLSALIMIPNWIFTIAFMYFFWISVPNIFINYNTQNDYLFMSTLPVDKKSIVKAKIQLVVSLEMLHIISAGVFTIIHNQLYGTYNFFLDLNLAFYGLISIMFGLFNITFLPLYFKTTYRIAKPLIVSLIVTGVYAILIETLNFVVKPYNEIMEQSNMSVQLSIFIFGIVVFLILTHISKLRSTNNFMGVNS